MSLLFLIVDVPTSLSPPERWLRFIKPLSEALIDSGIGRVLNLSEIVEEVVGVKVVTAEKVELEVRDWKEGHDLIQAILAKEGIPDVEEP